jgi:hypothetical protein
MSKIGVLKDEIQEAKLLQSDITSLMQLFDSIGKETEQNELIGEYEKLRERYEKFSIRKFLSNKYDKADAVMTIHAGHKAEKKPMIGPICC